MRILEGASRDLSVTQGSNASAQDSAADDMNARLAAAAAEREREQREQREAREREQRQKEAELPRQREQKQRERENREREARERRAKEVEEARKARELAVKKAERDAREAQEAREKAAAEAAEKAAREREAAAEEAKRLQEAAAATRYNSENYSDQAPASSDQPTSTATILPPSTAPRAQRSSFSSDMDSDDRQNSFSSQQKERPATAGYDETRDRRPTVGSVLGGSTSPGANRQNPYSDRYSFFYFYKLPRFLFFNYTFQSSFHFDFCLQNAGCRTANVNTVVIMPTESAIPTVEIAIPTPALKPTCAFRAGTFTLLFCPILEPNELKICTRSCYRRLTN